MEEFLEDDAEATVEIEVDVDKSGFGRSVGRKKGEKNDDLRWVNSERACWIVYRR